VSQRLCVAHAARGITSASRVAFVRNGQIVDNREPMADIIRDIVEALRIIGKDLEMIDQRIWKLENER
jgi:hypothetical protein